MEYYSYGIKEKTALTSSTIGNIGKLIPSLTEKKTTLNSLLPILSELKFPTNNKNTNIDTTTAGSHKPTTSNEQSLPTLAQCHHTKQIKPKTATPLTSATTKTDLEPISLEMFNRAAVDLDKKGEIELEHYKKYLFNRN